MKSHRTASPTTQQTSRTTGASALDGGSNSEAQQRLAGASPPRRTNLAFGFKDTELRSRNLQPEALKERVLDALHAQRQERTKDGTELTDSEKLFMVAKLLSDAGYTGAKLASLIQGMFFDAAGNSAADHVATVTVTGGEAHVTFGTGSGYHAVEGKIMPMIVTPPVNYTGVDTNARGAQVDNLQALSDVSKIPVSGTFLARKSAAVDALFLASRAGDRYRLNPGRFPPSSPEYKTALREYQIGLMADYLEKGAFWVRGNMTSVAGRSAQALTQEALDLAMRWTNANFAAEAHSTIELQDEAIAQRVLAELGFTVDVDTDAEALRRATQSP